MGSMGSHLPFNPFAFVFEGEKKKKGKKDTEFFFLTSLEKKRYPSFSTLPTISIGRVFVKGIRENVRDIVLFRFRCSRL